MAFPRHFAIDPSGTRLYVANQTTDTNVRATLAAQFDSLRTQIDQLSGDSGINGVNLLANNSLTITLNETGSSTVVISGYDDTTAGSLTLSASSTCLDAVMSINAPVIPVISQPVSRSGSMVTS